MGLETAVRACVRETRPSLFPLPASNLGRMIDSVDLKFYFKEYGVCKGDIGSLWGMLLFWTWIAAILLS